VSKLSIRRSGIADCDSYGTCMAGPIAANKSWRTAKLTPVHGQITEGVTFVLVKLRVPSMRKPRELMRYEIELALYDDSEPLFNELTTVPNVALIVKDRTNLASDPFSVAQTRFRYYSTRFRSNIHITPAQLVRH
jgi:hypothetical protein